MILFKFTATNFSAAYAGIWTSVGFGLFDTLMKGHHVFGGSRGNDILWLIELGVFFLAPVTLYVIGLDTGLLSSWWFFDPQQWKSFGNALKRTMIWLVSAWVSGVICLIVLVLIFGFPPMG